MLKVSKALLLTLLSLSATASLAQTIDELTAAARQAKMRSLQANIPAAAPPFPAAQEATTGMSPLPMGDVPSPKKRKTDDEPYLLSIYGIGTRLVAEIAEDGTAARYRPGDKTATGWMVSSIEKTKVTLSKAGKHGKVATKTLSFWRELDDRNDADTHTARGNRSATPPGPMTPPFPPSAFVR